MLEWSGRPGWSFHSKGLWVVGPSEAATMVGSGNWGARSAERDLELQAVLRGDGPRFRALLLDELADLEKVKLKKTDAMEMFEFFFESRIASLSN
jgi:phosphatidylserine/phosphatidylglycerophosphate/cardiolipin synthase-like enzyme